MRSPKFMHILAALAFAFAVVSAQAASIKLPAGTNWQTATAEQISEAVFNAVQKNPDKAAEIVTEAITKLAKAGRYSHCVIHDTRCIVHNREIGHRNRGTVPGEGCFIDVADLIGQAATRANPSMGAPIAQAVSNAVANVSGAASGGGGGGGGWDGGGGAPPPLPGGWGGGGGGGGGGVSGTGGGGIYSN